MRPRARGREKRAIFPRHERDRARLAQASAAVPIARATSTSRSRFFTPTRRCVVLVLIIHAFFLLRERDGGREFERLFLSIRALCETQDEEDSDEACAAPLSRAAADDSTSGDSGDLGGSCDPRLEPQCTLSPCLPSRIERHGAALIHLVDFLAVSPSASRQAAI